MNTKLIGENHDDSDSIRATRNNIASKIWHFVLAVKYGLLMSVFGLILKFVNIGHGIQDLVFRETDIYIPDKSILSALIGLIVGSFFIEQLCRKRYSEIMEKRMPVLPPKSRKRRWALAGLLVCLLYTLLSPIYFWHAHYDRPAPQNTILIYIDSFKIEGWDERELNINVKRALERQMASAFPPKKFSIKLLMVPEGITGQQGRLDWACDNGAKMIIYADGSSKRVSPHIRPCSKKLPHFSVFSDDTVDTKTDIMTASARIKDRPQYASLDPVVAQQLCVMRELTPETVDYMASLAMGLMCLYKELPDLDESNCYQLANIFFARAIEMEKGASCDLNYCEALYYLGNTKIELALLSEDTIKFRSLLWEADAALKTGISLKPEHWPARLSRGIVQSYLHNYQEASEIFSEIADSVVQCQECLDWGTGITALIDKGVALGNMVQFGKAIDALDEAIRRSDSRECPDVQLLIADALIKKGFALGKLRRFDEQVEVLSQIVTRFDKAGEFALKMYVAEALSQKGRILRMQQQYDGAFVAFDDIVRRFKGAAEQELQSYVVGALFDVGTVQARQNDRTAAINTYNKIIKQFGDYKTPQFRIMVAKARFNRGVCYGALKQYRKAIDALDSVTVLYYSADEFEIQVEVCRALVNKGVFWENLDSTDIAIKVYDEAVLRYSNKIETRFQIEISRALINKGRILGDHGRFNEAIIVCDTIVKQFGNAKDPVLWPYVAMALFYKSEALGSLNRKEEAARTYALANGLRQILDQASQMILDSTLRVKGVDPSIMH